MRETLPQRTSGQLGRVRRLRGDVVKLALVILFALLPLLLRRRDPRLEPYPALLFPGGAERFVFGREGQTVITRLELVGVAPNGAEHALDPAAFFYPISVYCWPFLVDRSWGLASSFPAGVLTLGPWSWPPRRALPGEKEELIVWLRERLKAVGHGDDIAVRVKDAWVWFDPTTGHDIQRIVRADHELDVSEKRP